MVDADVPDVLCHRGVLPGVAKAVVLAQPSVVWAIGCSAVKEHLLLAPPSQHECRAGHCVLRSRCGQLGGHRGLADPCLEPDSYCPLVNHWTDLKRGSASRTRCTTRTTDSMPTGRRKPSSLAKPLLLGRTKRSHGPGCCSKQDARAAPTDMSNRHP